MNETFSMASSVTYQLQLPHFYQDGQLIVEQTIAPNDPALVLKGSKPTYIPLSLTKTVYSRLSVDYFIFSLFSEILRIAPQWRSPTTIGYSVMHNPVELGSVASGSDFLAKHGVSVKMSLQINPNALLIEEESKYTLLDLLSKIGALTSSLAVVVVIVMNNLEE